MKPTHPKLEEGNVKTKPNGDRGWILGNFIKAPSPFHNQDFEIKWSNSEKGEAKDRPTTNKIAKTLAILVYGKFKMNFPDQERHCILNHEGDYVFFDAGIAHSWEVLEKCLLITIRWPSLPNDQ